MAGRRKKTTSKTKRISFKSKGPSRRRRKFHFDIRDYAGAFKVLAVVVILSAGVVGFVFLGKYVAANVSSGNREGLLKLVNPPEWVSNNEELKEKVYIAAQGYGEGLRLDENAAFTVQQNIASQVAWLDDVKVRVTHDSILVSGNWRRPLVMVEVGLEKCYVDSDGVVLDFVEISELPIVRAVGLSGASEIPAAGQVWGREDLAAAIAVISLFERMDNLVTPEKPLRAEIDRIDVSNFGGRQDSRQPHIILCAKDNVEIVWGAEVGAWQRHLESTDEQKVAKLYHYYEEFGTLLGGVKYINLCEPQGTVPLPSDGY